jgi:hypothetical protein
MNFSKIPPGTLIASGRTRFGTKKQPMAEKNYGDLG